MARTLGCWDCDHCGTTKMWGIEFDCRGCGRPRSRKVRFYQVPDAPEVTPEIAAQLGSGGPNWYCNHCDSGNKDNTHKCWNCGAPRGSSPTHEVKLYPQGTSVPKSTLEAEEADPDGKSWVEVAAAGVGITPQAVSDFRTGVSRVTAEFQNIMPSNNLARYAVLAFGGIGILSLVIFLVYQVFFNVREATAVVDQFHWTQSVTVQEYQVVRDSSWTSHPADAYNIVSDYRDTGRDEKIHDGWKDVPYQDTCYRDEPYSGTCTGYKYVSKTCQGTKDNGDGSFSTYNYECGSSEPYDYPCQKNRSVPYPCTKYRREEQYHYEDIFDWYYVFDVNRWISIATYPTSGSDKNPYYYSDFVLQNPYDGVSAPQIGQQLKFDVPGTYSITFYCDENTKVGDQGYFNHTYDRQTWDSFEFHVSYPIEINAFNGINTYPVP